MESRTGSRRLGGLTVLGALLVILGIGAYLARQAGIDAIQTVTDAGWPLFVIVPGVALLVASFFQRRPQGLGLAIPGAIVTSVGVLLFYQQATGHWESWAYAWALVGPGAAGLAMIGYGLVVRDPQVIRPGLALSVISAVVFITGYWYFETIFDTGRVPVDLGASWPLALIALGAIALVIGLFSRGPVTAQPSTTHESGGIR
jgi:hypothetical protein